MILSIPVSETMGTGMGKMTWVWVSGVAGTLGTLGQRTLWAPLTT